MAFKTKCLILGDFVFIFVMLIVYRVSVLSASKEYTVLPFILFFYDIHPEENNDHLYPWFLFILVKV